MISLEELLKIFENANFIQKALSRFYRSIRKSVVLSYAGRSALPLFLKLDEEVQWPILKEIDDPNLSIYEGTDPELLAAFIQTIRVQKERNSWLTLQKSVQERARLYERIFDFSPQEIAACKREGRRFEEILIKKSRKRRLMIGVGVGGGIAAAGAVGAGAFLWWKAREKK